MSQPGPSTSQITDEQYAVQEQLQEAGNLEAVQSMQSDLQEEFVVSYHNRMSVELGIRTGTVQ